MTKAYTPDWRDDEDHEYFVREQEVQTFSTLRESIDRLEGEKRDLLKSNASLQTDNAKLRSMLRVYVSESFLEAALNK